MDTMINQAVVFTKPLHHLGLPLTPEELAEKVRTFLEDRGFKLILERKLTGPELAGRDAIRQHYAMYSKASYGEIGISDDGRARFESAFGRPWAEEVAAGRITGNPSLMAEKGLDPDQLFLLWDEKFSTRQTQKIQDGVIMAWLEPLGCYCINGFYPAMEEIFYNPKTDIAYYVVEFDCGQVSWAQFRKAVLGSTDASKADPESLRGRLYSTYGSALAYPGRDNFVHGSAGPLEGLIERAIHEPDFNMASNPIGQYLAARGVSPKSFHEWKVTRTLAQLGALFSATEEKDSADALPILDAIAF